MDHTRLISVSNGILDYKHVEKIGPAIWLFLYLIDKVTKEDQDGTGLVLGGKPITDEEVSRIGLNSRSVRRHRHLLVAGGYITAKRAPHGYSYLVANSKKFSYSKPKTDKSDRSVRKTDKQEKGTLVRLQEPEGDDLGPGMTPEEQEQFLKDLVKEAVG